MVKMWAINEMKNPEGEVLIFCPHNLTAQGCHDRKACEHYDERIGCIPYDLVRTTFI